MDRKSQRASLSLHQKALSNFSREKAGSQRKGRIACSGVLQVHRVLHLPLQIKFVWISWKAGGKKGSTPKVVAESDGSCSWETEEIYFESQLVKDEASSAYTGKGLLLKLKVGKQETDKGKSIGSVLIDLSKCAASVPPEGKSFPLTEVIQPKKKKAENKEKMKLQATLTIALQEPGKRLPGRSSSNAEMRRTSQGLLSPELSRLYSSDISKSACNLDRRAQQAEKRKSLLVLQTSATNASSLALELINKSERDEESSSERTKKKRVKKRSSASLVNESEELKKAKEKIKQQEAMMAKLQEDLMRKEREEDENYFINAVIYETELKYAEDFSVTGLLIFYTLLHWKAFVPTDSSFVKIMNVIEGLPIKYAENSSMLYYWCSTMSTVLHLFREHFSGLDDGLGLSLSSSAQDAVEKKLKDILSNFFSAILHITYKRIDTVVVPAVLMQNTISGPKRTEYTVRDLIEVLSEVLVRMKVHHLFEELSVQLFRQLLYYINCTLFNALITTGDLCRCTNGMQIKMAITELEEWACKSGYVELGKQFLNIRQAADVLTMHKSTLLQEKCREDVCPNLTGSQLHALLLSYHPDEFDPEPIHPGILKGIMSAAPARRESSTEVLLDAKYVAPLDTNFDVGATPELKEMAIPIEMLKRPGFSFLSSLTEEKRLADRVSVVSLDAGTPW